MDEAQHAQAVFRLFVPDCVPAGDHTARLGHLFRTAAQNRGLRFWRQILGEGSDVERQHHLASHGIDIRHRVRRRNSAIRVSVVNNRGEKVKRRHHRGFIVNAINGGVVCDAQPNEQVRVSFAVEQAGEWRQHLRQGLRPRLGCSAAAGGQVRKPDLLTCHLPILAELPASRRQTRSNPTATISG